MASLPTTEILSAPCKGLVYAITGGGGGIGGATAERLAEMGAAAVAIADISEAGLQARKKSINDKYPDTKVMTTVVDVTSAKEVNDWTDAIIAEFGRLDGAGNIAGGERTQPPGSRITDIKDDDWFHAINVNLTGTMNCMRSQLKVITQPGGSILNCSSGAGLKGLPAHGAYGAAKWGVRGLTQTAAVEFGRDGITVNCLIPGPINSSPRMQELADMGYLDLQWMADHSALRRLGRLDEIAKVAAFFLSPAGSYVSGIDIPVDGGGSAMQPYKDDMPSKLLKK